MRFCLSLSIPPWYPPIQSSLSSFLTTSDLLFWGLEPKIPKKPVFLPLCPHINLGSDFFLLNSQIRKPGGGGENKQHGDPASGWALTWKRLSEDPVLSSVSQLLSPTSLTLWLLVPLLRGWVCFSVDDGFGYQHVGMLQFGLLDGQSQGLRKEEAG